MLSFPVPDHIDLLGAPYMRGARGPVEFDCYGLAREMFRRAGNPVPDFDCPGSLEEIEALIADKQRKWRRVPVGTPGALVTFRVEGYGSHVGFMLRDDMFIHAWESTGVTTERLTNGSFKPIASYTYG